MVIGGRNLCLIRIEITSTSRILGSQGGELEDDRLLMSFTDVSEMLTASIIRATSPVDEAVISYDTRPVPMRLQHPE